MLQTEAKDTGRWTVSLNQHQEAVRFKYWDISGLIGRAQKPHRVLSGSGSVSVLSSSSIHGTHLVMRTLSYVSNGTLYIMIVTGLSSI